MVHRVVRCVVLFIVGGMRTSELLDAEFRRVAHRPSPCSWDLRSPGGPNLTLAQVAETIRRVGHPSDAVLRKLVVVDDHRDLATLTIMVGLMPMVLRRGVGERNVVDELLSELALVIGNAKTVGFQRDSARLAGVLVDRAADRLRWERRRPTEEVLVGPDRPVWRRPSACPGPEELVVERVYFEDVRRMLWRSGPKGKSLVRCWDVAVALAPRWLDRPALAGQPREHYKHAVERLRAHGLPEQAA